MAIFIGIWGYAHYYPTYTVRGASMSPTFEDEEVVKTIAHNNIHRFDVVAIQLEEKSHFLLKRVIGLPGESLVYKNHQLYINGKQIPDEFAQRTDDFDIESLLGVKKIPENCYFLLGDNRMVSKDSRAFGFVNKKQIQGIVVKEEQGDEGL